ncbi:hypothetical protein HPB49_011063 [Dermacentor silvarum]|uniref:Uncharacterized protein n=1 Tax=Dermacentor silvarum TaxID=543639 RepID=A0ACB8C366_DERSI|nr:nucleoporin Nup37 [Dermacentor silvarum]KAH7933273.1 hypothetical protein HPB49_011063 [Dermacentor silvarum]
MRISAAERVMNAVDLDPYRTLSVKGTIKAVAFCPCKWNSSLLAVGSGSSVTVFNVKLPDEDQELKTVDASVLRKFDHDAHIQCIAWSPNMSLVLQPVWIRFATASLDNDVRLFYSDLKEDEVKILSGHQGPVNAVAFEPQSGEALASVGDDNTCRIWGLDGTQQARIALRSAGTAVVWHPDELGKLLVAEKRGTLRLYNAMTGQALMSMEVGQPGCLLAADWSPGNSQLLGAAVGNHCYLWETSRSSRPLDHKPLYSNGISELAFSCIQDEVCASRGHPNNTVKVHNLKTNQVLLDVGLNVGRGISWHHNYPVLAFGGDGRVHLLRVISC